MAFLIPCDDIIADIGSKPHSLDINPSLVVIGYQETHWNNNAPTKTCPFSTFQSLVSSDDSITVDNVVYIKYVDVDLWHQTNNIDRINGSGNTPKTETWDEIKHKYAHLLKQAQDADTDDSKADDADDSKHNAVRLHIEENPAPLPGQKRYGYGYGCRPYYYYRWRNPATEIIGNGYYEISDEHTGKSTKINIEKLLKKSYKKTKLYHESTPFKFLSAEQLDNVYRMYENMEINITNCSSLKALHRIELDNQREFKKLCVLNVHGVENSFARHSTLDHSLSRYSYDLSSSNGNDSDDADEHLFTNTMVYSPNCVVFNDLNGELTPNYVKLSFLTVYPVNTAEYYRVKRRVFDEPEMEDKFKKLDEKLANQNLNKKSKRHHHQNYNNKNKSKKRTQEENEEFIAKLNEMKRKINHIQQERIRRMIEIAIYNGCDAIVFDAFGCHEDSGNDVTFIAETFARFMKEVYYGCFRSVTFTMTGTAAGDNGKNHKGKKGKDDTDHTSAFKAFQEAFQAKFAV